MRIKFTIFLLCVFMLAGCKSTQEVADSAPEQNDAKENASSVSITESSEQDKSQKEREERAARKKEQVANDFASYVGRILFIIAPKNNRQCFINTNITRRSRGTKTWRAFGIIAPHFGPLAKCYVSVGV